MHSLVTAVSGKIVSEAAIEAGPMAKFSPHCQPALFVVQGVSSVAVTSMG